MINVDNKFKRFCSRGFCFEAFSLGKIMLPRLNIRLFSIIIAPLTVGEMICVSLFNDVPNVDSHGQLRVTRISDRLFYLLPFRMVNLHLLLLLLLLRAHSP
jgi:hypothetical protein